MQMFMKKNFEKDIQANMPRFTAQQIDWIILSLSPSPYLSLNH